MRRRALTILLACAAAACLLGALLGGRARAATRTSPLQIGASIDIRCTIITTPLSFGVYDVGAPAPHDVQGVISLNCSQSLINLIMHLRLGQGMQPAPGSTAASPRRQMSNGAGGLLRYDIYRNAARTQLWGDTLLTAVFPGFGPYPMLIPVYGRIPAMQQVQPGTYVDTLTATLFF